MTKKELAEQEQKTAKLEQRKQDREAVKEVKAEEMKAEEVKAKVIGLSALLTQTAYYQQEVIKYLKDTGVRDKYYVVVGGSPITAEWAVKIGADGYANTAFGAIKLLKRLVTEADPPPLPEPIIVE